MKKYEIPGSYKELFENGANSYKIINYDKGMDMDNNLAMNHFLESIETPKSSVVVDDGTQVVLKHPDFEYFVIVNCKGLGDFFSHQYEVTLAKEKDGNYVDYEN